MRIISTKEGREKALPSFSVRGSQIFLAPLENLCYNKPIKRDNQERGKQNDY
jgi:hypothetical protein